jgi:hypothetical protein
VGERAGSHTRSTGLTAGLGLDERPPALGLQVVVVAAYLAAVGLDGEPAEVVVPRAVVLGFGHRPAAARAPAAAIADLGVSAQRGLRQRLVWSIVECLPVLWPRGELFGDVVDHPTPAPGQLGVHCEHREQGGGDVSLEKPDPAWSSGCGPVTRHKTHVTEPAEGAQPPVGDGRRRAEPKSSRRKSARISERNTSTASTQHERPRTKPLSLDAPTRWVWWTVKGTDTVGRSTGQNVAIGLTGLPDVPAKRTGATARWKSHWPSSAAVVAHTSRSQLSSSHRPIATRLTA